MEKLRAQDYIRGMANAWPDNMPDNYWDGMRPISQEAINSQFAVESARNVYQPHWSGKDYAISRIKNQPYF